MGMFFLVWCRRYKFTAFAAWWSGAADSAKCSLLAVPAQCLEVRVCGLSWSLLCEHNMPSVHDINRVRLRYVCVLSKSPHHENTYACSSNVISEQVHVALDREVGSAGPWSFWSMQPTRINLAAWKHSGSYTQALQKMQRVVGTVAAEPLRDNSERAHIVCLCLPNHVPAGVRPPA